MNSNDRELLSELRLNIQKLITTSEYTKEKVDSLDKRVAIQNGRVTNSEKTIQHIQDTINKETIKTQIYKAIENNEATKFKRNLALLGSAVAVITFLANLVFNFFVK